MYRCILNLFLACGFVLVLIFPPTAIGGEPGYLFLRVGTTAKATALGDVFVSSPGDVSTVLYNPASVAYLSRRQVAIGYMDHLLDINSGYIGYAQPWKDYGVFGSSLIYFNYGDFEGYDVYANKTGSFGVTDWAWNVFYAQTKNEWAYGVNFKYIQSTIQDYSSSAIAMDLGAQYEYAPWLLRGGVALLNIGQVTKSYIRYKDPLPFSLQMGVSKKLENAPVTVGVHWVDIQKMKFPADLFRSMVVSAEINPKEPLFFRFGYNSLRRRDLSLDDNDFISRIAGLSAGIGYSHDRFTIDYSFTSWGIGVLNRFTFSMTW